MTKQKETTIIAITFVIGFMIGTVFTLIIGTNTQPDSATLNETFMNGTLFGYQYANYQVMQTGVITTTYNNETYYFKITNITEITQGQAIDLENQARARLENRA